MKLRFAELIETHKGLFNHLRCYDYDSVGRLVGGLLTVPNFHANTFRLDVLAHLSCFACVGKRTASREALAKLVGRHLAESPLCAMEDPVEDAFIGNVATKFGNFRVFRGLEESGDFWLERALRPFQDEIPEPLQVTIKQLRSLLVLSDTVAERLSLARYTPGSGARGQRLVIPPWRSIMVHTDALCFTAEALAEANIDIEDLRPFILVDGARAELSSQSLGHTHLDRFPLRQKETSVCVLAPHLIICSAQRFLLEQLQITGFLGFYDSILHADQVNEWFGSLHHGLDFEPMGLKLPPPPEGFPPIYQTAMSFDDGKYAHVLLLDGNIKGNLADSHGVDRLTEQQEHVLAKHMKDCAARLREQPQFNGGMTLVSRGGVGARGLLMGLHDLGDEWAVHFATLSDWQTLARCQDMSALRLWRMWRYQVWAEAHGLEIMNNNGLLNLFACWRSNNWRFLLREMPLQHPRKFLSLEIDFVTNVRKEVSEAYDDHSCLGHDGKSWIFVQRHGAAAYFASDKRAPRYVAPQAIRDGILLGFVKTPLRNWWVSCRAPAGERGERNVAYQLWDCLLNWVTRSAAVAERFFSRLPEGSVWVELDIRGMAQWADDDRQPQPPQDVSPACAVDASQRAIRITLPVGFQHEFHTPENIAERKLMGALFEALELLSGSPLSNHDRGRLMDEVFPNTEARFFHCVRTENWAHILANSLRASPGFIPEEAHIQSLVGLAEEIGQGPSDGVITGQAACLKYLQDAVDTLWQKIEKALQEFDRESVVKTALAALAELEKDAEHWSMTARSQFALNPNKEEVVEVSEQRRSKRDAATLTNRLLIETAMYACAEQGGRPLPRAEHFEILAHMQNLVATANHRDAISQGFMAANVRVFPNGELDVEEDFYNAIMGPYVRARFAQNLNAWADNYERWFSGHERQSGYGSTDALAQLEGPFEDEFGFKIDQLVNVPHLFGRHAREKRKLVLEFDDKALSRFLRGECGFGEPEVDRYLSRFSLAPRSAWNQGLSSGIKEADVFPWRFRRQLSLLMRPLILVKESPAKRWLVSPPVVHTSAVYVLGNLATAGFPVEHFKTASMRRFWGEQSNRQGNQFVDEVIEQCERAGFVARKQVLMRTLGVPASDGDFGDVDVLAWRSNSPRVLVIECKHLRDAVGVRDVVDRLDEYRGERDDYLGKHLRRIRWLERNSQGLSALVGRPSAELQITPLLVTSDLVPMQFFSGSPMPTSEVVPIASLEQHLRSV